MTFLLKNQNKKGRKTENTPQVWIHIHHLSHVEPHTVCCCHCCSVAVLQIWIRSLMLHILIKRKEEKKKGRKKEKKKEYELLYM